MSRFSYIKYDQISTEKQQALKGAFERVEALVNDLAPSRATALVYTKLEEAYMWTGKAIRDEQASKRTAEEQAERNNE